jgi:hypothetical protein
MCWYCGEAIIDEEPIGRSLRCETCGKDLRCCKNCKFYQAGSRADCAEPRAAEQGEGSSDKESANFCDWFQLNPGLKAGGGQTQAWNGRAKPIDKAAEARAAFESLFS